MSNASTTTFYTTFATTCHMTSYEWRRKMMGPCGSTSPPLTTCHVASCDKSCVKCCGTSIARKIVKTHCMDGENIYQPKANIDNITNHHSYRSKTRPFREDQGSYLLQKTHMSKDCVLYNFNIVKHSIYC